MNNRPLPSFDSAVPVGELIVLSAVPADAAVFDQPIGSLALNCAAGIAKDTARTVSDAEGSKLSVPADHDPVAM